MKFKEIVEGKLYQNKDFGNVYTKLDGLLYHVGIIYDGNCLANGFLKNELELKMYFTVYTPDFIRNMEFYEIRIYKD